MRSMIVNSQEEIDQAYHYADKSRSPHPLKFPCILKVQDQNCGIGGSYYTYGILIPPRKDENYVLGWLEGANYAINNEVD